MDFGYSANLPRLQMTTVYKPPLPSGAIEMSLILRFGYWESVRSFPSHALTLSIAPPASVEASELWNRKSRVSEATRSIDLIPFEQPATYPVDSARAEAPDNLEPEAKCRGR